MFSTEAVAEDAFNFLLLLVADVDENLWCSCAERSEAHIMMQEQKERVKRIEWNNVRFFSGVAVMSVAISQDSSRVMLVSFIKTRSFSSLTF